MEEIWKDIEDYEGKYQVSNLGRVRSLPRFKRKAEKVMNPFPITTGYLQVGLRKDGKVKNFLVHRLVMQSFDPVENHESLQVNHKDFDVTNNKLSNLEWCTPQENTDHFKAGKGQQDTSKVLGSNHHLSKLTNDVVLKIRAMYGTGNYSVNGLAQLMGIPESTLRLIVKGVTWKHLL